MAKPLRIALTKGRLEEGHSRALGSLRIRLHCRT